MSDWCRVLLTGVGGQGVMSAGRWLGDAAAACGLPVVMGQIHGLSQRGGSVQASVVIGGARSPEVPDGMADVLLGLEPMEAARAMVKVSRRTAALVNTRPLLPASLQSTGRPYPPLASLLGPIAGIVGSLRSFDASSLAEQAGSHRCLNVVMLGVLAGSHLLPFAGARVLEIVLAEAIPAFAEVNRRAFELGVEAAGQKSEAVHEDERNNRNSEVRTS
jgi:indolepyruvate ferredoxin oxidoreductase beta subunit